MKIKPYISIARPDHWIKNVFVLPGILLYVFFYRDSLSGTSDGIFAFLGGLARLLDGRRISFGLVGLFSVASANYVFNEILDATSDRFHPEKKNRPIPSGRAKISVAYGEWGVLSVVGMALGFAGGGLALGAAIAGLWVAGVAYNLPPVRLKDRLYMDVASESVNNPLRLLAGWYMAGATSGLPPPLSVMMAYWMFGAYLMAIKRYAEYRFIDDPEAAGRYRKSFTRYNPERLQESIVFYAAAFAFFSGVFIARYRIELTLAIPMVALCLAYYFHLGFRPNSPVQHPERLYRERKLMALVCLTFVLCALLLLTDVPVMTRAFHPRVPDTFVHP
jgi:decaprenyl-phosphate phosphoribosyltransferase